MGQHGAGYVSIYRGHTLLNSPVPLKRTRLRNPLLWEVRARLGDDYSRLIVNNYIGECRQHDGLVSTIFCL